MLAYKSAKHEISFSTIAIISIIYWKIIQNQASQLLVDLYLNSWASCRKKVFFYKPAIWNGLEDHRHRQKNPDHNSHSSNSQNRKLIFFNWLKFTNLNHHTPDHAHIGLYQQGVSLLTKLMHRNALMPFTFYSGLLNSVQPSTLNITCTPSE